MGVVRWTLTDDAESASYEFDINPFEEGSPQRKRNVDSAKTVAPDGRPIVYEGAELPQELSWKGVARSEEHYNALVSWYRNHHQVLLTDDLGREMWIYITSFKPERVRSRQQQWKHQYELTAIILDWETEL